MSIQLRPHQNKLIEDIRTAFKTSKSVLAVAPVGFGKTIIAAYMGKRILEKKTSMFFCVHTKALITQTHRTFDKFSIPYGFIAAGYYSNNRPIQVCSVNTLRNRINKYPAPSLVVIDEAHFGGTAWAKMVNHYKSKGCFVLGLTASPWKLSSEGLGEYFDTMVEGPTTKWLIDNKYLSQYRLFIPSTPDLGKAHIRMGDYVQEEIEKVMDRPTVTGCAVEHWKKYANGKRTICFCTSIEHSKHTSAQFNASGITSAHLDGESTKEERQKIINDFADGKIKVITNCSLFTCGFDLGLQTNRDITVEAVILLRPTASLSLFIQMTGRALRYKDYPAVILDHANCTATHGFPCSDRKWSLEGRKVNKKSVPSVSVRICKACFGAMNSGTPKCTYCGYEFEVIGREVKQVEGDLQEVKVNEQIHKADRGNELWRARTYKELFDLGVKRGYKNPGAWSYYILKSRKSKNEKML